ncbi:MAG: DUF1249 domain-containing protein [Planctomycetes bacterium]|nr:DUF1249 domain-containing protein [Planctomycetota bacterium]
MKTIKINGINYEITKSDTPEDKERMGFHNIAKTMREKGQKRHCYLKRPKGETIYWIIEYERGFIGSPVRLGGPKRQTKTTAYQRNYKKLEKLGIVRFLEEKHENAKLKRAHFMDLNLDRLYEGEDFIDFAMAHNYIQNGDVVADPDMQVRYYPRSKTAEALTYQDAFGYQEVYADEAHTRVYPKLKRSLNIFLSQWLTNLVNQGFKFQPEKLVISGDQ